MFSADMQIRWVKAQICLRNSSSISEEHRSHRTKLQKETKFQTCSPSSMTVRYAYSSSTSQQTQMRLNASLDRKEILVSRLNRSKRKWSLSWITERLKLKMRPRWRSNNYGPKLRTEKRETKSTSLLGWDLMLWRGVFVVQEQCSRRLSRLHSDAPHNRWSGSNLQWSVRRLLMPLLRFYMPTIASCGRNKQLLCVLQIDQLIPAVFSVDGAILSLMPSSFGE